MSGDGRLEGWWWGQDGVACTGTRIRTPAVPRPATEAKSVHGPPGAAGEADTAVHEAKGGRSGPRGYRICRHQSVSCQHLAQTSSAGEQGNGRRWCGQRPAAWQPPGITPRHAPPRSQAASLCSRAVATPKPGAPKPARAKPAPGGASSLSTALIRGSSRSCNTSILEPPMAAKMAKARTAAGEAGWAPSASSRCRCPSP